MQMTRARGQSASQAELFETPSHFPEGFRYQLEFIDRSEEHRLVRAMERLEFAAFEFHGFVGKRRVVSFGWRYDFNRGGLQKTEDMPDFLLPIREAAGAFSGLHPSKLQQVLLTEYSPGAAIGWHKDRSIFGDVIGISLLSACPFRFRRKTGAKGSEARSSWSPDPPIYCAAPPGPNGSIVSRLSALCAIRSHFGVLENRETESVSVLLHADVAVAVPRDLFDKHSMSLSRRLAPQRIERANVGTKGTPACATRVLREVVFTGGLAAAQPPNPLKIPKRAELSRRKSLRIELHYRGTFACCAELADGGPPRPARRNALASLQPRDGRSPRKKNGENSTALAPDIHSASWPDIRGPIRGIGTRAGSELG
jgi:alkylated DNA repair dioxygenase AlkB